MTEPLDLDAIAREVGTWPGELWAGARALIAELRATRAERDAVPETTLTPTEEEVEAVHHEIFRRSGSILDRADVEAALRAAARARLGRTG
jgi:hypothetical protein